MSIPYKLCLSFNKGFNRFKKISFIFCFFAILHSSENLDLPNTLFVNERFFSLTTAFDIKTKEETIGTVHRKCFSWTPEYHLKTNDDELLAKATMKFWSFMVTFDIVDDKGIPLGSVNEKLTWFYPSFKILSPTSQKLAEATFNFWETKWTITDPENGQTIAILSRPFFGLLNDWTVHIPDPLAIIEKGIHPHMLLTILAFQVDKEYWEAQDCINVQTKSVHNINIYQELLQKLEKHSDLLTSIEPTDEDFSFSQNLPNTLNPLNDSLPDHVKFRDLVNQLIDQLSSDTLTLEQKAALFLMLQHKLSHRK